MCHYAFLTIGQLLSDQRSRELLIESILYCWQCLLQDAEFRNRKYCQRNMLQGMKEKGLQRYLTELSYWNSFCFWWCLFVCGKFWPQNAAFFLFYVKIALKLILSLQKLIKIKTVLSIENKETEDKGRRKKWAKEN